jgi:hypothetical protein
MFKSKFYKTGLIAIGFSGLAMLSAQNAFAVP